MPFPSDLFTVADLDMVTKLRVDLPPEPCGSCWQNEDIEDINRLDGFSMRPRVTSPRPAG